MSRRFCAILLATLLWSVGVLAQPEALDVVFRRANEHAAHTRWDDAIREYRQLVARGVRAPSLYWNWAQVASARGSKGEAIWALLCAQDLTPSDASVGRELERIRAELGLDPSELSLGFLGDARRMARRYRFDGLAAAAFLLSLFGVIGKKPRTTATLGALLAGVVLSVPLVVSSLIEPRGVVVIKDAALVDTPRVDAVALASLREGEVVPILSEEGEYVRIQDASSRGYARKMDVRKIGTASP